MTQAQNERDADDEIAVAKMQGVVAGVHADPTEGPDSSLLEAFGYTRKSERKSGLSRKGGATLVKAEHSRRPDGVKRQDCVIKYVVLPLQMMV